MRTLPVLLLSLFAVSSAGFAFAQTLEFSRNSSQGAIVVHEGAPVYASSKDAFAVLKLHRGDAVSGYNRHDLFFSGNYFFEEANGRLRVTYLVGSPAGTRRFGWMDSRDLSRFTYDGACSSDAGPFASTVFEAPLSESVHHPTLRWNSCFEEARDRNLLSGK
jgi:hypothetical protein